MGYSLCLNKRGSLFFSKICTVLCSLSITLRSPLVLLINNIVNWITHHIPFMTGSEGECGGVGQGVGWTLVCVFTSHKNNRNELPWVSSTRKKTDVENFTK